MGAIQEPSAASQGAVQASEQTPSSQLTWPNAAETQLPWLTQAPPGATPVGSAQTAPTRIQGAWHAASAQAPDWHVALPCGGGAQFESSTQPCPVPAPEGSRQSVPDGSVTQGCSQTTMHAPFGPSQALSPCSTVGHAQGAAGVAHPSTSCTCPGSQVAPPPSAGSDGHPAHRSPSPSPSLTPSPCSQPVVLGLLTRVPHGWV